MSDPDINPCFSKKTINSIESRTSKVMSKSRWFKVRISNVVRYIYITSKDKEILWCCVIRIKLFTSCTDNE